MIKTMLKTLVLGVVLLIATALPAWASQGIGSSPYAADLLISGLNTGRLDPGQEYWYAYSRLDLGDAGYNSIVLSLNFEAQGRAVASRVNFQVFTFEQVDAWLKDNSGPVDNLGLGTPASADFDVNTGERLWSGFIEPNVVYYVRVFNVSPSPITYRLTALGQKSAQFDKLASPAATNAVQDQDVIPVALNTTSETGEPAVEAAAVSSPPERDFSIVDSLPVQPIDGSPSSTRWLLAAQAINGLPPQEAAAWLMSAATLGWLPLGGSNAGLVPVNPNPDAPLVSTGEGDPGGAGEVASVPVEPDPLRGDSIYPSQPLRLLMGRNVGRMGPHTEHWYTFTPGKVDDELIEDLKLTMFFTPGEPNLARHVIFELFTGSQYQIWERGTPEDMEHFGAGSWVSRDGDYDSGERLWRGTVVDGDQYFVKLTNDTAQWVDYYLFTDDIINTELGLEPEPGHTRFVGPRVVQPPTGKDIGSPLPIFKGHTQGRLEAGEDIWYRFNNFSLADEFDFQHHVIRLDHTPGAGHVTNYVNVEIYPYQEQHIWQRGDTDKIRPLGAGSDLAYDKETDTHTWIWDGHFVTNTIYFIRVRNDGHEPIDFDLAIERRP